MTDDNPRVRAAVEAAQKALAAPWMDSRVRVTVREAIAAAIRAYDRVAMRQVSDAITASAAAVLRTTADGHVCTPSPTQPARCAACHKELPR